MYVVGICVIWVYSKLLKRLLRNHGNLTLLHITSLLSNLLNY